jgi:hypothetical protein
MAANIANLSKVKRCKKNQTTDKADLQFMNGALATRRKDFYFEILNFSVSGVST